ncbi:hypothetical protein TrVFT333_002732 [Trichoderma virens FT-333]|nr:hypothetical protein TrVFT333_002732 [Trichoderma virens FT-333]
MAVRKAIRCVYPTKNDVAVHALVPVASSTSHMLIPCSRPCRFHLSPHGERDLLWAACSKPGAYIQGNYSQPSLYHVVRDIFDQSGISVTDVVAKYFDLAYYWLPTLDREAVCDEAARFNLCEAVNHDAFALLLLCMHAFAEGPCEIQAQSTQSVLYRTSRQLFVILQTSPDIPARTLLQCGIILTTYACGHGMSKEAYEILTICIGLIRRLSIDGYVAAESRMGMDHNRYDQLELDLCWSGIILLDRTIVLSNIDQCLPYLVEAHHIPPTSAIFQVSNIDLYSRNTIRNLLARAEHAVRLGDMLKDIQGPDTNKYEAVEAEICNQISEYIHTTEGGNFPLCETVAMSLSALIMLYRKQSYYRMPIDNPKAALTFNCVHNMIMDTCRDEAEWVQAHGWSNNTRPCFFGLCCLYGAAAQLNELRLEGLSTEDIWTLRNSLLSFSNRWRLGGEKLFKPSQLDEEYE